MIKSRHRQKDPDKRYQFFSIRALWPLWLAHGVSLALHGQRFSWWYIALWFTIIYWHRQVVKGRWFLPGRLVKSGIVIASAGLLWLSSHNWLTLEPLVNLLVLAFVLKLLELKHHRDGTIVLFLSYFVTACHFLFYQTLLATLLGLISLSLTTAALVHWQASRFARAADGDKIAFASSPKKALVVMLQSIPLMLILLFVLPRLGTLWSVPLQGDQARVGMSDTMSPGDISQLSKQGGLAFRVEFINQPVPLVQRYWRGLVLTEFDGRRWQRADKTLVSDERLAVFQTPVASDVSDNDAYRYRVMLEPTGNNWLYAMPVVSSISYSAKATINNELLADTLDQRIQYEVLSNNRPFGKRLSNSQRRKALNLPEGFDLKTRRWAKTLYAQAGSPSLFIDKVLQFYRDSFTYTLSPPKLGRNTIDEFLFSTQRGFCEHFASSFVVVMRSVGIPARVVVGYQGGQWNETNQYLRVSQNDAHAWAEVWLQDKGWIRVDPTAAVAPSRIENGLFNALDSSDQEQVSGYNPGSPWLTNLRLKWDSINYQWQRWVMSFDDQQQKAFLKKWFGNLPYLTIILICGAVALSFMSALGLWYFWQSKQAIDKDKKLYLSYVNLLQKRGVDTVGLINLQSLTKSAKGVLKNKKHHLDRLHRYFEKLLYASNTAALKQGQTDKRQLRQAIRKELKSL